MSRVLFIEPDIVLAEIYRGALEAEGYQVDWAVNAQAAVELADTSMPDVVVLELQLARHNGIEFLYEFRSYPDWQHIPIILHTHVSELPASPELLDRLGVKATLYKPSTSLAQLLAGIEQLLVPNSV